MTFEEEVAEAARTRTDVPLADRMTGRVTQYGNMNWTIRSGPPEIGTQKAWPFPTQKDKPAQVIDRETERKGRALVTVNQDDFSIKPAPKAVEAD